MRSNILTTKFSLQSFSKEKRFYIVAYHNIIDKLGDEFVFDLNNVSCDKKSFEEHLVFYKDNFTVIHYSELNNTLNKNSYEKPILIITFDDAYKSFYNIAAPLLKKHNLPATVFLPTDYIDTDELFWWDELIYLCNKMSCEKFYETVFSVYFFPDSKLQYALNNGDAYFKLAILRYLKEFSTREVFKFFRFIRGKFQELYVDSKNLFRQNTAMTWEQVEELSKTEHIEIGSHTLSHCLLEQCSLETARKEIVQSKQIIEHHTQQKVVSFCYPAGRGAVQEVQALLLEAKYDYACLMQYGKNNIASSPFYHKRIPITLNEKEGDIARIARLVKFNSIKEEGKNYVKKCITTAHKLNIASSLIPTTVCQKEKPIKHVFFSICDHFEPYWHYATHKQAYRRVKKWLDTVPGIFDKFKDADGHHPVYSFFYPAEEYKRGLLNMLQALQVNRYGEVEIHLHHDGDTSDTLRHILVDFREKLANEHGLLCRDRSGKLAYAFIHGNWALDNSRSDGRWCGVNDEINILEETGCYADFTMPSAPSDCQTKMKNSIYYAVDDPLKPMSHNTGEHAVMGSGKKKGLLMVQGPLVLRRSGIFPKIENGEITYENYVTPDRMDSWIKCGISVKNRPDWIFIKLHAHGTQESTMKRLFELGHFEDLFTILEDKVAELNAKLHYTSARQMANVIHSVEDGAYQWNKNLLDYHYTLNLSC